MQSIPLVSDYLLLVVTSTIGILSYLCIIYNFLYPKALDASVLLLHNTLIALLVYMVMRQLKPHGSLMVSHL